MALVLGITFLEVVCVIIVVVLWLRKPKSTSVWFRILSYCVILPTTVYLLYQNIQTKKYAEEKGEETTNLLPRKSANILIEIAMIAGIVVISVHIFVEIALWILKKQKYPFSNHIFPLHFYMVVVTIAMLLTAGDTWQLQILHEQLKKGTLELPTTAPPEQLKKGTLELPTTAPTRPVVKKIYMFFELNGDEWPIVDTNVPKDETLGTKVFSNIVNLRKSMKLFNSLQIKGFDHFLSKGEGSPWESQEFDFNEESWADFEDWISEEGELRVKIVVETAGPVIFDKIFLILAFQGQNVPFSYKRVKSDQKVKHITKNALQKLEVQLDTDPLEVSKSLHQFKGHEDEPYKVKIFNYESSVWSDYLVEYDRHNTLYVRLSVKEME